MKGLESFPQRHAASDVDSDNGNDSRPLGGSTVLAAAIARWLRRDKVRAFSPLGGRKATKSVAGFVYLIEGGELHKIGRAIDISKRLAGLQTLSPLPLKLVGAWYVADCRQTERKMHSQFAKCRVRGEWFRLGFRLFDLIDTLEAVALRGDGLPNSGLIEREAQEGDEECEDCGRPFPMDQLLACGCGDVVCEDCYCGDDGLDLVGLFDDGQCHECGQAIHDVGQPA